MLPEAAGLEAAKTASAEKLALPIDSLRSTNEASGMCAGRAMALVTGYCNQGTRYARKVE